MKILASSLARDCSGERIDSASNQPGSERRRRGGLVQGRESSLSNPGGPGSDRTPQPLGKGRAGGLQIGGDGVRSPSSAWGSHSSGLKATTLVKLSRTVGREEQS
ncbi:hypothetical protein chiPu_0006204 [Chiloscyllium punctatum]|uniref:Uncharacterized protein n=1 Tax=Chiloscyllium punctatum TaxID=137246 RepID=A0A401SBJ8_CHIPU|nr:hypothetical protein [Chiloscyllium punctatum]